MFKFSIWRKTFPLPTYIGMACLGLVYWYFTGISRIYNVVLVYSEVIQL